MIRLISSHEEKRDFLESLDEKSNEKIRALREYAFRGIADELILGFRTEDDNSALIITSRNECVLITEDAKLIEIN